MNSRFYLLKQRKSLKNTELLLFARSLPFATPHRDLETTLMKYVSIIHHLVILQQQPQTSSMLIS